MPKFSIIVPVYNVAPYFEACITSVLQQSYNDFELILIDDGSTDGCSTMCDTFAAKDSKVRVFHQKNKGLSAARNAGIGLASGEYIIFLDSDDFWKDAQVLNALAQRLLLTQPDVLSFNYIKYDGQQSYKPYFSCASLPVSSDGSFRHISAQNLWIACAWNKAIRRKLFSSGGLNFIEGITSEDMDWCVRLALNAERFDYLADVIVCYRQREASISQRISLEKVRTVMENIHRCLALLESNACSRSKLLKPFVSYQYGTALFHLAVLPQSEKKQVLFDQAKAVRYLLKWSKNKKVKLLDFVTSVGGLKFTLWLLKLKNS